MNELELYKKVYQFLVPSEFRGIDSTKAAQKLQMFLDNGPPEVKAGAVFGSKILLKLVGPKSLSGTDKKTLFYKLANRASANLVEALKAIYLLCLGAGAYETEISELANKNGPSRKWPDLKAYDAASCQSYLRVDALVIGSGAGGAIAALELSKKGAGVVILEEGQYFDDNFFRSASPLTRYQSLYRQGGTTACLGIPPVIMPIGRGVGGTTLVNSGTCYKTPDKVINEWHKNAQIALCEPQSFKSHLDDIFKILEVAPVDLSVIGNNALFALKGAQTLGYKAAPLNRNAQGCDGCCQCAIGCPHNAKLGVCLSVLPMACENGAVIIYNAKVEKLVLAGTRVVGALAKREDGSDLCVLADTVVLSAGTTQSPLLLARSGIKLHKQAGKNMAIHPAVALAGRFNEEIYPWRGVLQSASVEEFHESDSILVEATSTPPGMGSMILPGVGNELLDELNTAHHLVTLGAMVSDEPNGGVIGKRNGLLYYKLSKQDGSRLLKAMLVMAKVLFAAGAVEILTGLPKHPKVKNLQELEEVLSSTSYKSLHLAAFHPTGTLRMGRDEQKYPVDPQGKLRGVTNLIVADGSVVPSTPEVNPQVSIMALSKAIIDSSVQ